jgi:hypothetical protein
MKPKEFAVVMQWGGGHIYFMSFFDSEEKAHLYANSRELGCYNEWRTRPARKRGAKPHVSVWRKLSDGIQLVEAKEQPSIIGS